MLRIAIQAKGRLNEQSIGLLSEAGIGVAESKRKLISRADGFPMEVLYLRDDDIPQAVSMGVADLGIVGLNEVAEKGFPVEQIMDLGFGGCRLSLAVPKTTAYEGLAFFRGRRVATSYPNILARYFAEKGIEAEIHTIEGSVEIAPAVGMADGIFDIVSSGGTLISNGLVEVEKVLFSEAVLIACPGLDSDKRRETEQLTFRRLGPDDSFMLPPGMPHNVYLSEGTVLHTVKYGSTDVDWEAAPELDDQLRHETFDGKTFLTSEPSVK